jgi:hypothetical protein
MPQGAASHPVFVTKLGNFPSGQNVTSKHCFSPLVSWKKPKGQSSQTPGADWYLPRLQDEQEDSPASLLSPFTSVPHCSHV